MEVIWIISLNVRVKIDLTKHMFCWCTSSYRIGFVGHMFFNCDEVILSCFFFEIALNSCLIGLDQLKHSVLVEVLGERL